MKTLLILSGLLVSFTLYGQYTPQQVKKFRVSRITSLSAKQGSEEIQKTETWFDENGNDTAEYLNGQAVQRAKYEYDRFGHPVKRIRYRPDGSEIATAVYNYNPDSSYTISNTDKDFGMTDYAYYAKSGKIIKTVAPDKTEIVSTYDSKGRLTHLKSTSSDNGGIVTDIQYIYNSRNQVIREISKGDDRWTKSHTYNVKGLIIKTKINSITDDIPDPEVIVTYEYEFRK